jgi:hypothetical protein
LTSRGSAARRHVRRLLAGVLLAGCIHPPQSTPSLGSRAVETLGARDGYVFVFNPLNCSLAQEQIDALNAIATRTHRSGILLTLGPSNFDDSTSAAAVARLGLRMKSVVLARTPLRGLVDRGQMAAPVVIALRGGRVVGIVAGGYAERVDTWIEWLEQSSVGDVKPGGVE